METILRKEWTAAKRRQNRTRYDLEFSPDYDQDWGHINSSHARFVDQVCCGLSEGEKVLDAACGTGKYWPRLFELGLVPVGIDQSQGMLNQAHRKFPRVAVQRIGLQEMTFFNAFSAVLCVDALENIFPEDWPAVLKNFRRALRPGGAIYFTVEIETDDVLQKAYDECLKRGFPVLYGEVALEGYHYYPADSQVQEWCRNAGLAVATCESGDGYRHYLAVGAPI